MSAGMRKLRVDFGRRWVAVEEISRLEAGSVVQLDPLEGDLVEVYVSGRLIARGEAVVVDGHLGVRVREMVGDEAPE